MSKIAMRSRSVIVGVVIMAMCCDGAQLFVVDADGQHQHDGVGRTVNRYHHAGDDGVGGGWIIGGSRRRASAGASQKLHYNSGGGGGDDDDDDNKLQQHLRLHSGAPATALQETASSLSEIQVVVHQPSPLPHRNVVDNEQQQSQQSASSKWYTKRPLQQAAVAPSANGNAALLAEVLGHKSGFNTSAGTDAKGYYYNNGLATGSKGFQNDLMDMLGKSTCTAVPPGRFFVIRPPPFIVIVVAAGRYIRRAPAVSSSPSKGYGRVPRSDLNRGVRSACRVVRKGRFVVKYRPANKSRRFRIRRSTRSNDFNSS